MSNSKIGLKNHSRSPSAIENAQHHDPSRSKKVIKGIAAQIKEIFNDALVHPVTDDSLVRIANDTGATIYAWVGDFGDEPGTVDNTNGFAILDGTTETLFIGASSDISTSKAFKLSGAAQAVVTEA